MGAIALDACSASVRQMVSNLAVRYGIPILPVDIFLPGVMQA